MAQIFPKILGQSKNGASAHSVPHRYWVVKELRADREFAVALFREAMETIDSEEDRAASLSALRAIAEAYGGVGAIAKEAGLSRESLYRSLGPKGNPTLRTLIAVLKPMGLRLSVVPAEAVKRGARPKAKRAVATKRVSVRKAA